MIDKLLRKSHVEQTGHASETNAATGNKDKVKQRSFTSSGIRFYKSKQIQSYIHYSEKSAAILS